MVPLQVVPDDAFIDLGEARDDEAKLLARALRRRRSGLSDRHVGLLWVGGYPRFCPQQLTRDRLQPCRRQRRVLADLQPRAPAGPPRTKPSWPRADAVSGSRPRSSA